MCIGIFTKEKFEIVNNPEEAEIIVINTCGFIESAKEAKKVFNQKQILIGTYFNEKPKITSDFKQKINFMKEK